jgi:hypothetical protein
MLKYNKVHKAEENIMSTEWNNGFENNSENNNSENFQNSENRYQNEQEYAFQMVTRNGKPKTKGWAVASMVLGIISVVCCCFGWSGILLGVGAVILAIVSRRNLGYFDGMTIAGLILGIFGFVFGTMIVIYTLTLPPEFWEEYFII